MTTFRLCVILLNLLVFAHACTVSTKASAASLIECQVRAGAGYRCTAPDGTTYDEQPGPGPLAPRELVTDPEGRQVTVLRPFSRLGDLLRARLVSPQAWLDDAGRASMHAPDYANRIAERADKVLASCRAKRGGRFIWLGRINPEGVPAFNLTVSDAGGRNDREDCFIGRIQAMRLPVPPGVELYDAVGGFPVAWESAKLAK
jgi:hypothetical protein